MKVRKATFFVVSLSCLVFTMTSIATAGYTSVIVYGDSLSDNGNVFALTGIPPAPYYNGRFSNGIVTVEYLANSLHSPLNDFAYGGATTGVGNEGDGGSQSTFGFLHLPGMQTELAGTIGSVTPFASTSLFVVWGGPNDFLSNGPTTATADTAVANLVGIVSQLQLVGAKHIFVPGMPDLGLTPSYASQGPLVAGQATALSLYFNHELVTLLPHGVTYFNTFGFLHQVVANPGAYGLTDVTDPCFNGSTVCSNPSQYLFWDGDHPTTYADSLLAAQFQSAIPEPSTFLMLCTSMVGLAGVLRRKMAV
jgi:phospholipase/lecithinase/hemolysin